MPNCPKCKYEYVAGTKECPDCGVALVEHIPNARDADLALLTTANSILEARTIADYLKANQIPCVVRPEGLFANLGEVGPASIFVREDQLERAQTITGCRLNP